MFMLLLLEFGDDAMIDVLLGDAIDQFLADAAELALGVPLPSMQTAERSAGVAGEDGADAFALDDDLFARCRPRRRGFRCFRPRSRSRLAPRLCLRDRFRGSADDGEAQASRWPRSRPP